MFLTFTAWKFSKYGIFSAPYFPVFGLNTEKYGPGKMLYMDIFHAGNFEWTINKNKIQYSVTIAIAEANLWHGFWEVER